MIHIATIHHEDDRWIDLQLRRLERHTAEPYRVYARLHGVDPRHHERFHHVSLRQPHETHEARNGRATWADSSDIVRDFRILAETIAAEAGYEDWLVFLHGDAFPIADWVEPVKRMLASAPLVGVRRDEEFEPYPHPCFTVATVGFWTEIDADWSLGPDWEVRTGLRHNDLGTALLDKLEQRGIDWHPILRSNSWNPHPVWFGVYGGFLYHHGAGFRRALSLRNVARSESRPLPRGVRRIERKLRRRADDRRSRRFFERIRRDETVLDELAGIAKPS